MNKKVYIYDLEKAYYYIENGIRPIEVPREHYQTHKVFFVFDSNETQDIYNKWKEKYSR
jgi:hypothetical protein